MPDEVIAFVEAVKAFDPDAVPQYTRGGCYQFHKMLKERFGGEAWYDQIEGHVLTKVGDAFYDVTGRVSVSSEAMRYVRP